MALTTITKDFIVKSGLRVEGSNSVTTSTAGIGTLSVNGGAAVAGNIIVGSTASLYGATTIQNILNVAGDVTVNSGKAVITAASGNIYTQGNVGVQGTFNSTGTISLNDLFTVNGTTGDVFANGTGYFGGDVGVEGAFNSTGTISLKNLFTVDGTSGDLFAKGTGYFGGDVGVKGAFNSTGTLSVNNSFTVNGTTGNVFAKGTGYFGSDVGVEGTFNSTGTLSVNDLFSVAGTTGNLSTKGTVYAQGNAGFGANVSATGTIVTINSNNVTNQSNTSTAAVSIQAGGLYVNKSAWIDGSIAASAGANGALVVQYGGAYIGNNLYVASTANDNATLPNNSIYTAGGLGVEKNLGVGGNVTINGNLTVLGTQTIVNSTATAIQAPVIDLGTNANNAPLTLDDGYNKGLVIHYYDTTDNHMFLGRNDATGHLVLRHNIDPGYNGTIPNADYVNNGVYASMDLGSLTVNDTTASNDFENGALQVAGGVGVAGDIYLRDEIGSYNKLYGTATQADNLNGGAANKIAYQSASGVTTFIAAPTLDNQVLTYTAADGLYWNAAGNTTVSTATNIAGGVQYDIPFQSSTGVTGFDTGLFQYNDTAKTLTVDNATLYGTGGFDATVSLTDTDGGGVELYSASYAQLNYDNTGYVWVNSSGTHLSTAGGQLTLDTSGNLTLSTTGGTFQANYVDPTNLTSGRVTYYDGTSLTDSSGLTYDGTGALTVGTSLTVSGSGGDITMTGGNITGVNNVSATSLTSSDLTDSYVVFAGTNGVLTDDSAFTYASSTLTAPNFVASSTTDTTGSSDGALVVDGGAYVAKRLFVNGDGASILANGLGDGAVAINGGLDVNNNIWIAGGVDTNGGTETAPDLRTSGGAYIGTDLYVGSDNASNGGTSAAAVVIAGGTTIQKDLYVGSTATINGDLFVDGTIFVKGNELTGIDQISGSTATFANLSVTNTATIANLTVTGSITLPSLTLTNVTATNFTVTGNTSLQGTTATVLNVTGNSFLNGTTATTLNVTGASDFDTLQINSIKDNGYGFNNAGSTTTGAWSLATAGGIYAFKNITAGGVVSAGDVSTVNGNDTGSVDAFYAVNNIQAARTVGSVSGSTPTEIDRWDATLYTSAKYIVQIVDSGSVYVSEIMIMQVGGNAYISEYGIVNNDGDLGEYSIVQAGSNLVLKYTPTSATAMTIQVVRQSIFTAIEGFC